MDIDKKRVSAVQLLEARGFTFTREHGWSGPRLGHSLIDAGDKMHAALVSGMDALASSGARTDKHGVLAAAMDAVVAYEVARWPDGKVPGGRG